MKKLLIVLMCLFNICYGNDVELFKEISNKTVLVVMSTNPLVSNSGEGSGVVVDFDDKYNYILTNAHVCRLQYRMIFIIDNKRKTQVAEISFLPEEKSKVDLCIMKSAKFTENIAKIAEKTSEPGSTIFNVNYGWSTEMYALPIYLKGTQGEAVDLDQQFFVQIVPGASGSGLFNESGELIGVPYLSYTSSNVSIAMRLEVVKEFLKQEKEARVK